jgi:5-methylcytosine-specific restriction enzyme subunit McrC
MPAVIRVSVTEDVPNSELLPALRGAGMSADHALATVVRQAGKLRQFAAATDAEGTRGEPVRIDRDRVTFSNLAGVIRVGPGIEVDLAPKFLGDAEPDWREDFIAIASVTGEGMILAGQNVSATVSHVHDLASLIGHVFGEEFFAHRRTPLRIYQRRRWRDYALDGDLDIDEALVPDPDGLPQRAIQRDLRNPFNALLAHAATLLLTDVRHPLVRTRLAAVVKALGPQGPPPSHLPPVPSRHRRWAPLIELARQVAAGFEISLREGSTAAPGFLLRSWQAWEQLINRALRDAFGPGAVSAKRPYLWGRRGAAEINVRPDVSFTGTATSGILDAKYKGRAEEVQAAVGHADLMEAAAFMAASSRERIALIYPRTAAGGSRWAAGTCRVFDRADLHGGRVVLGVEVEVRGFGARGGRRMFTDKLAEGVIFTLSAPIDEIRPGRMPPGTVY